MGLVILLLAPKWGKKRKGKGEGVPASAGLCRGLAARVARKGADTEPGRKGLYSGVRLTSCMVERRPPR